jgi:hypothetical protein
MLSKETFIFAMESIVKHNDMVDEMNAVNRKYGVTFPCLDYSELHLPALLRVLEEAMEDSYGYIGWWLYEAADKKVYWQDNGTAGEADLSDLGDLYDYMVSVYSAPPKDTIRW